MNGTIVITDSFDVFLPEAFGIGESFVGRHLFDLHSSKETKR